MINILMNTSMIDEKWCCPVFSKVLKPGMKVCVAAITFFDDTKTRRTGTGSMPADREYGIGPIMMYSFGTGSGMRTFHGSIILRIRKRK